MPAIAAIRKSTKKSLIISFFNRNAQLQFMIFFLVVFMLLFTVNVFAAAAAPPDWRLVGSDSRFDYYVDANNVLVSGNAIQYWGRWDSRQPTEVKQWVCKREIKGNLDWQSHPGELSKYDVAVRQLEIYQYNDKGQEVFRTTDPEGWRSITDAMWVPEIQLVLKITE